jgi:hypothetical protein
MSFYEGTEDIAKGTFSPKEVAGEAWALLTAAIEMADGQLTEEETVAEYGSNLPSESYKDALIALVQAIYAKKVSSTEDRISWCIQNLEEGKKFAKFEKEERSACTFRFELDHIRVDCVDYDRPEEVYVYQILFAIVVR